MFDARYVAFAALSALLVISPGATFAVVVETGLGYGRKAALLTVAVIGLGNATLAAATAFGLSAVMVPQFIGPQDAYLTRALVLSATHVAMSVVWQGSCGLAVGVASEHMSRPAVRRTLEGVTSAILVFLGARLLL